MAVLAVDPASEGLAASSDVQTSPQPVPSPLVAGQISDASAAASSTASTPFGGQSRSVPGTIQAEDFDDGGEGVAYHDTTTSNQGGSYRSTGVDLQATTDTGGGYNVGWVKAGEWLEYTVDVPAAGAYTLELRVASSGAGGTMHVESGGANLTGPVAIPNTGGWQKWQTLSKGVTLGAGTQVVRVAFDGVGGSGSAGNLNWLRLTADDATVTVNPTSSTQSVVKLVLINADTDQPIAGFDPLGNGATLNLATLPTRNLNIRAVTNPPDAVGSVRFALDGNTNFRTETSAPYALAGDDAGNYRNWTPTTGSHTLTATPYTGASAGGTAGTPLTVTLNVLTTGASGIDPYRGHPLIPNLISISPSVTITDASGTVPFVVQTNAADTVAKFSDGGAAFRAQVGRDFDPYLDLEYDWDFGDAAGAETLTHPVTGAKVNAVDDQSGPEAMYVYRKPGAYPITLTVRGRNSTTIVSASTRTLSVEEVQQISLRGGPTGGTYTLSFGGKTTAPLAYNALADAVQAALAALPGIGAGNVESYGGLQPSSNPLLVFFRGKRLGQAQPLLTANASGLTGGSSPSVFIARVTAGSTAAVATASAWSGQDRYFQSNYDGSKGSSNGTIERPYTKFSDIESWVEGGSNRRALLKRGSSWQATGRLDLESNQSGARIVSYGTGPRPRLYATQSFDSLIILQAGFGDPMSDVVIDGLELDAGPSERAFFTYASTNGDRTKPYGVPQGIYLLDERIVSGSSSQAHFSAHGIGMGTWRTEFDAGGARTAHGLLGGAIRSFAVVGGSFSGGGSDILRDHHIYPTVQSHSLYRWIDFQGAVGRNYAINGNVNNPDRGGVDSNYHLIDGSDITGTANGLDFSNTTNSSAGSSMDRIIVQNSAFHVGQIGTQGHGILAYNPLRLVVRDNLWFDNPRSDLATTPNAVGSDLTAYRNIVRRSSTEVAVSFDLSTFDGGYLRENIFTTDIGRIVGHGLIDFNSADAANWRIDVNQYFAPNYVDSKGQVRPFFDKTKGINLSFEEWQRSGWDIHGSYGEPD